MAVLSRSARVAETRQANREAIAAATLQLLEAGTAYADISVEQIVRQAGLSRPTFYKYFRDKRELILHLGGSLQEDVAAAADPWLQSGDGDVRTALAAVLEGFRRHRGSLAALVEAATYDTEVNAFWHSFHERFYVNAASRIRAGHPHLSPKRADARAFALVWMTERSMSEYLAGADVDEAALLDELAALWNFGTAAA